MATVCRQLVARAVMRMLSADGKEAALDTQ
jgi:hypothetical protein